MKLDWTELVLQFPIPLWFGSIKGLKGRLLRLMRDSKTLFHTNKPPEINWTAHKSAWECELGSHISALRSDLSAQRQGQTAWWAATAQPELGAQAAHTDWSRSLWTHPCWGASQLSWIHQSKNRLKINQRKLFWIKSRDQPQVCARHKLLCVCYAMELLVYAFSWWQMHSMRISLACNEGNLNLGSSPMCAVG